MRTGEHHMRAITTGRSRASRRIAVATMAMAMLAGCASGNGGDSEGEEDGGDNGDSAEPVDSGGDASDQEQVVLDFPNFQAAEAPFATWWDEFIEAFEEDYPNVTVEVASAPNSAALAETLVTRFSAGDPPSFIQQTTANFATFAAAGNQRALDYLLPDTDVPELWGPLQDTYVWEGETQGVMSLASGLFLHYNEQLLEEAGVEVPTTPEELVAAAEAVHDPDNGIYGFVGTSASQDTKLYNEPGTFVFGQGADWYEDGQPNFDDPAVIEALETYRSAMATAPPGIQHTQRNTIFQNGQGAFMFENANFVGAIKEEAPEDLQPSLKAAPAPFEIQPGTASVYLGIPEGIEGAELEAAENFLLKAITPEWQQRYAELVGAPAPHPDSVANLVADDPQMEMFAEYSSQSVTMHPDAPEILAVLPQLNQVMFDAMVEVSSTDRPIADIMADLQAEAETIVG